MSLTEDELKKVATDMGVSYEDALKKMNDGTLTVKDAQVLLGTTAKEAEQTISGSVNSMKAAFDNFLNGSGSAEDLADSVTNVLTNVSDAIVKLAPNILTGIVTLVEKLLPQVAKILGMSQTGYSKYETGENDLPSSILIKLADFYGISVDELVGHEIKKNW